MAGLFDAETETLARAFAASSAAFLERLRYLQLELNKQCACWAELSQFDMKKLSLGYRYPRNGPHDPYLEMYSERWKSYVSPQAVLLLEGALRTVEGWRAARGVNAELNNFDGKTILDTTFQFCDKENFTPRFIGDKQDIFNQAVERFALSLSVTTQPLTAAAAVPPPTKPAKRIRTKKRWTFPEIDTHIEQVLKSGDPEKIKAYVFEADEELASRIGCNKKTLYKTQFWQDERERMQAEWRRLNTAGEIPKKRDQ